MGRFHRVAVGALLLVGTGVSGMPGQSVSYQRDVLPILSDRCYRCHGPDEKARQGGLRLDLEVAALQGSAPVILPHRSAESALMMRITSPDPSVRMPPLRSHLSLTPGEIEILGRWIDEGAPWGRHWAFQPLRRPEVPEVVDEAWARGDLDRFVLAALEGRGLRPSREANRATLLRRVTLDLTGLPPTLSELEAFIGDRSDEAYERVVDRLLESPRYGERMAWEWLDAGRYADTDGFQADPTRDMWPWRDWLIKALNDNVPFDRFTIEMLAGDMVQDATPEQIVASGFHRNHMYNGEGGRIPEETRVENVFDRTETTSTVWLGLTMTCARCHDHKYDPISQREYYELSAFFDQTSETGRGGSGRAAPTLRYHSESERHRLAAIEQEMAALDREMQGPDPECDRAQRVWECEETAEIGGSLHGVAPSLLSPWHLLGPLEAPMGDGAKTYTHRYGPEAGVDLASVFEDGRLAWRAAPEVTDGRVHMLPSRIGATYLFRTLESPSARGIEVSLGSDDGIVVWMNGVEVLSKEVNRAVAPNQERLRLDLREGRNELLVKIVNTGGAAGVYFNKVSESIGGLPDRVARSLVVAPEQRNAEQRSLLLRHFRSQHSKEWNISAAAREQLGKERGRIEQSAPVVMVMDSLPKSERRRTRVLERGAYDQPRGEVFAETPRFLPPMPSELPRDRMGLARWLVSDENPLTARVAANRAWQLFLGRGLVATPEDFGQQGGAPSHPQLLDWLATTLRDGGWDVKALHRRIVLSATYRQTSAAPSAAFALDPHNVDLARGPRFRLPSWMLRDQALAASGLLVTKMGGRSINPYQPDGVWADATFGQIRYRADKGDALYRRSLYVFWRRIVGPTVFFDTGKRQACSVQQIRTNTPLHALTTLNETGFVEAARFLAERAMAEDGPVRRRIAAAFRALTLRSPSPDELDILHARWRAAHEEFVKNPDQARNLLSVGDRPRDPSLDLAEHAAYTIVCSVLLNLDEVLTKP